MLINKTVLLKNGKECLLRNVEPSDAKAFLDYFEKSHGETDYLTTYPDETEHDLTKIAVRLDKAKESPKDIEVLAFIDNRIVGNAGYDMVLEREKTRHRANFGITILKEYWGLGIGTALTTACIEAAKEAGYLQLELETVSGNERAMNLYTKYGFVVYGRNPRGFISRTGKWQELVLMRLELDN